jgi:hypothetical protein
VFVCSAAVPHALIIGQLRCVREGNSKDLAQSRRTS